MERLVNMSKIVLSVLQENPECRSNDNILVKEVLKRMGLDVKQTVEQFADRGLIYIIPSIIRTRRKIQVTYPRLDDVETRQRRTENEERYIEYSHINLKEVM